MTHLRRFEMVAQVSQRKDTPNAWGVEAVDDAGDGQVFVAIFSGGDAYERAVEYANAKFAGAHVR